MKYSAKQKYTDVFNSCTYVVHINCTDEVHITMLQYMMLDVYWSVHKIERCVCYIGYCAEGYRTTQFVRNYSLEHKKTAVA